MLIAILSAMEEECVSLIEHMTSVEKTCIAGRDYYQGQLWGKDIVIVFSRWGKVAAASTTVVLIREFKVSEIIFTGVAGAIDKDLSVGDVVVGDRMYQHDLDARPMIKQYEIPLLGIVDIETDVVRRQQIYAAAELFVSSHLAESLSKKSILEFNLHKPKVVMAAIATGDQFITCDKQAAQIKANLPNVVCVEMEGGAVAQVCNEYGVKFSVIRTISDSANSDSSIDFPRFVTEVAREYSLGIMSLVLAKNN